ncbi:cation-translocating P-type ATPase [Nocardia huaxiensis]|uniref:Cation-transporting P-type ATPase n=1 Tax=Nocardia huaxiensis TaxID=2755382 RepID=A0A7D6V841_9NOCA|nr:cation-transporting P-type ATPase [Nocardia huaxiensis]QLY28593.1 cation-transporting P-type ATPase [Nocardia huaxiensis]UFS97936.1 cation-transporting P-type ATPase [Nocardia huaxiensis]
MTASRTATLADAGGLSSAEVAVRRARDGANVLPRRPPVPLWRRVANQLRDPLIIVLLVAVGFTAFTRDWTDLAVIALVIVANTAVGVTQEVRADRAISALSLLTAPTARVIRDGVQCEVPATEVVVGDLLALAEGDIVAADATVREAAALLVDESALTGESVAVNKDSAGDRLLSAGTVVVRGRGRAVVTAVGAAGAVGRIARELQGGIGLTPLQRRLVDVGRLLAVVTVVLCVIVFALGLLRGQPFELMAVTAVSLAVAAVPESLPAVVTLGLALGARRMAARHALIRRLPAVETLGSVTVLATDKTGTLTEGRMVVREIWTPTAEAVVTGSAQAPIGTVRAGDRVLAPPDLPPVTELLSAAALCNDARLLPPGDAEGEWTALGDPTEVALLSAAVQLGLDRAELAERLPRIGERPFDSDRKRMSTIHRLPEGRYRVLCKGAPEALLQSGVLNIDTELLRRTRERADQLAHTGFRVLAVAQADHDGLWDPETDPEHAMTLLGLVAILDPPRPAAAGTITACREAGIRPVLITGDHPGTARAIATDTGIIGADGAVVDCRPHAGARLPRAEVYARATPSQKLDIIQDLRDQGQVVAMNGDGVNDAPALRHADIGVAMGRRGTEVARQAADLVLADDDLGTVVAAVEEGRRIYANIRRFLVYGLSGGATEITVMLAGPFLGLPLPLLPAQILWINLLTHGLPGVALGGEPADPGTLRRGPRPPTESILGAGLWQRVLRVAVVLTAVTLGVAVWAQHTDRPWQTMAFFALGATQLGAALGSRARPRSLANPMLLVAVVVALALQVGAVYLSPLQQLLGTESLALADLLIVSALSVLGYAAVRLDRVLHPADSSRAG